MTPITGLDNNTTAHIEKGTKDLFILCAHVLTLLEYGMSLLPVELTETTPATIIV